MSIDITRNIAAAGRWQAIANRAAQIGLDRTNAATAAETCKTAAAAALLPQSVLDAIDAQLQLELDNQASAAEGLLDGLEPFFGIINIANPAPEAPAP